MTGLQRGNPSTTLIILIYLLGMGIVSLSIFLLDSELLNLFSPLQFLTFVLEVSLPAFALNGISAYIYFREFEVGKHPMSRQLLMAGIFSIMNFLVPFIISYALSMSLRLDVFIILGISFTFFLLSVFKRFS